MCVDGLLLKETGGRRGGGGAADAALKTKTPHVNVGNNSLVAVGCLRLSAITRSQPLSKLALRIIPATVKDIEGQNFRFCFSGSSKYS